MAIIIIIICVLTGIIFGYMLIPNFFARNRSNEVIKTLPQHPELKKIALTFDDGPDSRYTRQVMDVLKEFSIQATFFLVANKLVENKDIIKRMLLEGHQVAHHSYCHRSAWLSLPWQTMNEMKQSKEVFRELSLRTPWFRPPWGTFNAFTMKSAKQNGLQVVLWSLNAADWSKKQTPEGIVETILENVKSNDIIVLHDSGGYEFAPLNTIEALKNLLPLLIMKGFQFVTIEEGLKNEGTHKNTRTN